MKKYLKLKPNEKATHLKIELYYHLGGTNWYTYKNDERGYYLSICPVSLCDRGSYATETYEIFSGRKILLYTVKRKSKNSKQIAIQKANEILDSFVNQICNQNNIEVEENENRIEFV